jgi:hypothetical protein
MASGSTAMLRRVARTTHFSTFTRSCQASAEHFQQGAEFLPLRNRGLGPMPCVTAPLISARDRLVLSHRRWPSGKPRSCAFCRSAPAVRFMAPAIFLTADLLLECALSSRTSSFDQGQRLGRARLVAIKSLPPTMRYERHLPLGFGRVFYFGILGCRNKRRRRWRR